MESPTRLTVDQALVRATGRLRASGSESPRLDAEVLLAHVLGVDRTALFTYPDTLLGDGHLERFESSLERRSRGEPVAYVRGLKEFHGVALSVDPRALIPRPETETLVELAIERIRDDLTNAVRAEEAAPYLVWDVGTGSGAIAIAIAAELRRRRYGDTVRFHLSDVSSEALDLAKLNVVAHAMADLMSFARGDLTAAEAAPGRLVDLVVANLPYVPSESIASLPVAAHFEPALALDGGAGGLVLIRRLLHELRAVVAEHGAALLEIGSDQAEVIDAAARETLPDWQISVHPDLSGRPRVVRLERDDARA